MSMDLCCLLVHPHRYTGIIAMANDFGFVDLEPPSGQLDRQDCLHQVFVQAQKWRVAQDVIAVID